MKKRFLCIILAALILPAIYSASVYAADKISVKEIASGLDYDGIGDFHEGLATATLNKKTGYIDKTGKLVIPCVYDDVWYFNNGLARVKIDGKENYIDKSGKIIITIEYDEIGPFSDGMAWVRKGDKYGYINKNGDLVIPIVYDVYHCDFENYTLIHDFSEGLSAVSINGKCGFIDKTGVLAIPAIYDGNFWNGEWAAYIPKFSDGLARVRKDNKWGVINKAGEEIVPFELDYRMIGNSWTGFRSEPARVCTNDKAGFIDKNGNFVVPLIYNSCSDFNGALAFVCDYTHGELGAYIDRTGKIVTPFEYYADLWSYWVYAPASEGMTVAQKNGKFGCLDEKGNVAVPFNYDNIYPFSCGLAFVENKDAAIRGFVDKTGKMVISIEYRENYAYAHYFFSDGLVWLMQNDKYGYADTTGEIVVPYVYDSANNFSEGLAVVQKDGKWAILEIQNYSSPKTNDPLGIILISGIYMIIILTGLKKIKRS